MLVLIKSAIEKFDPKQAYQWEAVFDRILDPERHILFQDRELSAVEFLKRCVRDKDTPSLEYFSKEFPDLTMNYAAVKTLGIKDISLYVGALFDKRARDVASSELAKLSLEIPNTGFTDEHFETIRTLYQADKIQDVNNFVLNEDTFMEAYERGKDKPTGLMTFVKILDEQIGGIAPGTVGIIAGYVGQFKTTFALNMAVHNAKRLNFNVVFMSFEMPKESVYCNVWSIYSAYIKHGKAAIPHDLIRKHRLSDEEKKYLAETLIPDFKQTGGKFYLLDESDFVSKSFTEIRTKLENLDDKCIEETGSGIDAVFVDYVNILKYVDTKNTSRTSEYETVNKYISFFRQIAQAFRKDSTGEYRKLAIVPLMQINREGWRRASRHGGVYDLTALAEANEGEKAASTVITVFTTEDMKLAREASVQLLKNRNAGTITDPVPVYVDPARYIFGDDVLDGPILGEGTMSQLLDSEEDISTIFG